VLHLSSRARDEDLPGEWVAVHELAHLALPPMPDEDAWFFEGVVSYYQEVLRARAGFFDERTAWRNLHEGFGRGMRRRSERTLAQDSADMHAQHAYHRVYWAGAALALRWDVALRRQTGGRASLDAAVRALRARPDSGTRLWTAKEACAAMEAAVGTPFCAASAERALASSEFPAVDDALEALGVRREGDGVRLVDDAPDANVRRAIMSAPAR
jgi:predicted metalloprotease with PDZ domain